MSSSNTKYHTVRVKSGNQEIADWCLVTIDSLKWFMNHSNSDIDTFYFANEADKVMFVLRWL